MQPLKITLLLRIATTRRQNLNSPDHHRYGHINPKSCSWRDWRSIRRMLNSRNSWIFSSNSTSTSQLWKPSPKCPSTLDSWWSYSLTSASKKRHPSYLWVKAAGPSFKANYQKKIKDLSGLVVECKIADLIVEKALADSGASINVMPYKLFLKLGCKS